MSPNRTDSNEYERPEHEGSSSVDFRPTEAGADRVHRIDPIRQSAMLKMQRRSFIVEFAKSKGPPQIGFLCMLLAFGFGSTIGVVPAVMSDRYARLNHGYTGIKDCAEFDVGEKQSACLAGSSDAQNAVAMEQLISNTITFFTSSLVGSLSDEYGRKGILVLGLLLSLMSPLTLVLIQLRPTMSPTWYYLAGASTGLVNWITVALSSLSDVMPKQWRAPSFGLLIAGFSLGFALAPQLALLLGHFQVSVVAFFLLFIGLVVAVLFYPETLPPTSAAQAQEMRLAQTENLQPIGRLLWNIQRPVWELSILNRSTLFRLLSVLAFFSGLVSAGDRTLIIYYIEEQLGFDDKDVAVMFMIMGFLGIFVQGVMLKILNDAMGERILVTFCFALGAIQNLLYGLARTKVTIFVAVGISSFVSMSFPTISAIKSNNVEGSEQGRIQGALYSLSALASGCGPIMLRFVYHYTKDGAFFGPGSMFIVASAMYVVASFFGFLLPPEANSKKDDGDGVELETPDERSAGHTEPLI